MSSQIANMDAVYLLKNSRAGNEELRFSLRSMAKHAPFIKKVWIFGDLPHFISTDTSLVEHVPHAALAGIGPFKTPVCNTFLLVYLSSLIPELTSEFVFLNDDFVLLDTVTAEHLRTQRYLEDLSEIPTDRQYEGFFKNALIFTANVLKRFGHSTLNFENHLPTLFTRRQVLEAYLDLRNFASEDRWFGVLAQTAILNHAFSRKPFPVVRIRDEGKYVGFHYRPYSFEQICEAAKGKWFLNFDDESYDASMRRYLAERFPEPSKFEIKPVGKSQTVSRSFRAITRRATDEPSCVADSSKRKTILFALELGGSWGHVGVIQPMIRKLIEMGNRVVLAAPQLPTVLALLSGTDVGLLAAPSLTWPINHSVCSTYAEILNATCFANSSVIEARCGAWQALFAKVGPDVIVCDHAPAALLAARTVEAAAIPLGQGFTLPDAVDRMPLFRKQVDRPPNGHWQAECAVVDRINQWLAAQGASQLARLSDLLHDTSSRLLATLPELDCYAPRSAAADYVGVWSAACGSEPVWPDMQGKRVLAYLKPFKSLPVLLEQLRRLRASSIVVCPGIDPKIAALCENSRVSVQLTPVDLDVACRQCDIAIGHGTHGFTSSALLAGKPQVMLPLVMEQRLTGQAVSRLGAGRVTSARNEKQLILAIREVWNSRAYADAAKQFSLEAQCTPEQSLDYACDMVLKATKRFPASG